MKMFLPIKRAVGSASGRSAEATQPPVRPCSEPQGAPVACAPSNPYSAPPMRRGVILRRRQSVMLDRLSVERCSNRPLPQEANIAYTLSTMFTMPRWFSSLTRWVTVSYTFNGLSEGATRSNVHAIIAKTCRYSRRLRNTVSQRTNPSKSGGWLIVAKSNLFARCVNPSVSCSRTTT